MPCAELPSVGADLRAGDRLLRRAGPGLQCRDQAVRGPRGRDRTGHRRRRCAGCWPAQLPAPLLSSFKDASLAAAREAAPEFARALLIDEVEGRLAGAGRGGVGGRHQHQRRAADGGPWPSKSARPATCSASTRSTTATLPGRWSAWVCKCVITDAPDVILAALAASALIIDSIWGLRSVRSLGGLSSDRNKTDTSQSCGPSIHRRGFSGRFFRS